MSENVQVKEGVATGILGKKLGMTQIFDGDTRVAVTVIEAGPCVVLQVKDEETDGYKAVQLGFAEKKPKRTTRPLMGHFYKIGVSPKRMIREFRIEADTELQAGDIIDAGVLEGAKLLDIQGISKGKGTAGVMKKWNFGGGRASHGNSKTHRAIGSIGRHYSTAKGVPKNQKMAGRMGNVNVTARGISLVEIDTDRNLILVKGSVPGANGGYLIIKRSLKDPSRKTLSAPLF